MSFMIYSYSRKFYCDKNASLTPSGNFDKICKERNSGGNGKLSHLEFTFHKDLSWKENKTSGV